MFQENFTESVVPRALDSRETDKVACNLADVVYAYLIELYLYFQLQIEHNLLVKLFAIWILKYA
jgi:hypothetical protein